MGFGVDLVAGEEEVERLIGFAGWGVGRWGGLEEGR